MDIEMDGDPPNSTIPLTSTSFLKAREYRHRRRRSLAESESSCNSGNDFNQQKEGTSPAKSRLREDNAIQTIVQTSPPTTEHPTTNMASTLRSPSAPPMPNATRLGMNSTTTTLLGYVPQILPTPWSVKRWLLDTPPPPSTSGDGEDKGFGPMQSAAPVPRAGTDTPPFMSIERDHGQGRVVGEVVRETRPPTYETSVGRRHGMEIAVRIKEKHIDQDKQKDYEKKPGFDRKRAAQGLRLLSSAVEESAPGGDPELSQALYIDGAVYILRALPDAGDGLSALDRERLSSILDPHGPNPKQQKAEESALHMTIVSSMYFTALATKTYAPLLLTRIRRLHPSVDDLYTYSLEKVCEVEERWGVRERVGWVLGGVRGSGVGPLVGDVVGAVVEGGRGAVGVFTGDQ